MNASDNETMGCPVTDFSVTGIRKSHIKSIDHAELELIFVINFDLFTS